MIDETHNTGFGQCEGTFWKNKINFVQNLCSEFITSSLKKEKPQKICSWLNFKFSIIFSMLKAAKEDTKLVFRSQLFKARLS